MTKDVWLKVGARKSKYSTGKWEISSCAVFVKTKPNCKANEIVLKLALDIPDEIFEEPIYKLKATLPKPPSKTIEHVEIAKDVAKALSERMGMKVKISMESPPDRSFTDSLKSL